MLFDFYDIKLLKNKIKFYVFNVKNIEMLRKGGNSFFFYNDYLIVVFIFFLNLGLKVAILLKCFN